MIRTVIGNGNGSLPSQAKVFSNHALKTYNSSPSYHEIPISELERDIQYSAYFKTSAGVSQMGVNGSVTNIKYQIKSEGGKIVFIDRVRFILESQAIILTTGGNFRVFSTAGVLTNGILFQINQRLKTDIFTTPVKAIGDFVDSADLYYNFTATYSPTVDYLMAEYKFTKPIPLIGNELDTIDIIIRDNLTATATLCPNFVAIAYGWQSDYQVI